MAEEAASGTALARSSRLSPSDARRALDLLIADATLHHCLIDAPPSGASAETRPTQVTRAAGPSGAPDLGLIRTVVGDVLRMNGAAVDGQLPLWDIGADSRTLIEIVQRYEAASGASVPLDTVLQNPTLTGIVMAGRASIGVDA
jgi:hypothetical protein